ncbi:hypothetical protein V6N12_011465 [Hibiscus sabdariffa]|uniref:RNase H type-1 domain-containing protein n=1 Tax=Hibiscus sabdariffa TaxID=183260 RepID=A0ABR2BPH8_9ROSI
MSRCRLDAEGIEHVIYDCSFAYAIGSKLSYCKEIEGLLSRLSEPILMGLASWVPPPAHLLKINVDACFVSANGKSCSGIIIRNHVGLIMGAALRHSYQVSSSFEAEALAVVNGLLFASELGFRYVILECIFSFVPWSGNKVAHAVATLGRLENEDRFWIKEAPSPALELAVSDHRAWEPP